jgi:hypothetical protein
MNIRGYAFDPQEEEKRAMIQKRYNEIKHLAKDITLSKFPRYGKNDFKGMLNTEETQKLSELDIAIIADQGNLCFGGSCTKIGNTFTGCYYTD